MDKIPDANHRKARSEGEVVGLLRQIGGQRAYASSPVNLPLKITLSDIFLASLKPSTPVSDFPSEGTRRNRCQSPRSMSTWTSSRGVLPLQPLVHGDPRGACGTAKEEIDGAVSAKQRKHEEGDGEHLPPHHKHGSLPLRGPGPISKRPVNDNNLAVYLYRSYMFASLQACQTYVRGVGRSNSESKDFSELYPRTPGRSLSPMNVRHDQEKQRERGRDRRGDRGGDRRKLCNGSSNRCNDDCHPRSRSRARSCATVRHDTGLSQGRHLSRRTTTMCAGTTTKESATCCGQALQ